MAEIGTVGEKARARAALEAVIARFDFAQVRCHMFDEDWRWSTKDGVSVAPFTPTVDYMKKTVRELFEQLAGPGSCCRTGGFAVFWEEDEMGTEQVRVTFKPKNFQEDYEYVGNY
jgi:hypothetical protein